MLQGLNTRQTRSRTRALAATVKPNLQMSDGVEVRGIPADAVFKPSEIDTTGGEQNDCDACGRPNKAEPYMVQCEKCEIWYHFSCANVSFTTVQEAAYTCAKCITTVPFHLGSRSDRSSTASSRQARVALELQRLEEEMNLQKQRQQERLAKEKALMEKSQRDQLELDKIYMDKKYELLNQQNEEMMSVRSHRSNRISNRVKEWVEKSIGETGNVSPGVVEKMSDFENSSPAQLPVVIPVEKLGTKVTSTPLTKQHISTDMSMISMQKIAGSITIGEPAEEELNDPAGAGAVINSPQKLISPTIPPVNVQKFIDLLNVSVPTNEAKLVRSVPYDQWQKETLAVRRQREIEQQHQRETVVRRNRELELVNLVKRMEIQREEELQKQHQRENEIKIRTEMQLAERDDELKRLRSLEHELRAQLAISSSHERVRLVGLRQELEQTQSRPPDILTQRQQSEGEIRNQSCNAVDHGSMSSRVSLLGPQELVGQKNYKQQFVGEIDINNWLRNSCALLPPNIQPHNCDSNMQRSQISSHDPYQFTTGSTSRNSFGNTEKEPQPAMSFPENCRASRNLLVNSAPPISYVGPTSQQVAARQVVSKELPIFTGDPVDWPIFSSSYFHSTAICGYSDSENLLRLQRSLRGSARESVSSFLLHPATVPQVVATLQMLYGRPEQIVYSMINKIRTIVPPKAEKLDTLVTFGLTVQNLCGHLKAVGMVSHLSNPILLQELVDKLPPTVKFNWALYQQQLPIVDLDSFGNYMAKVASATVGVTACAVVPTKMVKEERAKGKEKVFVNTHAASGEAELKNRCDIATGKNGENYRQYNATGEQKTEVRSSCPACNFVGHQTGSCQKFKRLCVDDRWKLVKERKLCRRCLTPHTRWPCKGEICGVNGCQRRHHRLLHYDHPPSDRKMGEPTTSATVTIHRQPTSSTLFRVLPVTLYGTKGKVDTYAFLDDGSSVTLVEKEIAEAIGVAGKAESLCIQWTSGINKTICSTRVSELKISGANSNSKFDVSDAYTVDSLGLPEQTLRFVEMEKRFAHLRKLPVKSFSSACPGILIGLSNSHLLASLKLREGRRHEPIATKTRIGWAVYGSVQGGDAQFQHRQMHICDTPADASLYEYVREFFSVESLGVTVAPKVEGTDDKRAREILDTTTVRTSCGKFKTGLLWKHDVIKFPDSRPMAEKRLKCLERRLVKEPALYENVRMQIADFERKGYAHRATTEEIVKFQPERTWYLPLGIVLNPKKPGKVRVIWDAAAKVNGISLNTMLMKGPDLLTPLLSVLFQYRERSVAICADIQEMFHQVLIQEKDRSAQLFLWRDSPERPMVTMVTDVAIFGATCSPAHSQYVKNLNATENEADSPRAALAIKNKHYVDDYLDSVDTVEEAVDIAMDVAKIHAKAGFHIRNWQSNSTRVLEKIGGTNLSKEKRFMLDKESCYERLLGMIWLPEEDMFSFSVIFSNDVQQIVEGDSIPTKRELLKVVMSIYDPLGLVTAFIIHGKILVQDVWRTNTGWDEKIPHDLIHRWTEWLTMLQKLNTVMIPRCYFPGYNPASYDSLELHIFVDASEQAFAAVAYFRIVDHGCTRCVLVSSKTKVASLQPLTIPRLELQAAVLGARLRKTVEEGHSLQIKRTYFWSDSSTVNSWIKSDLRRYRQYVAFRVNEILSLSNPTEWRWLPSKLNVADEATKWGKGPSFDSNSRWYQCPAFLGDEKEEWPKDCRVTVVETTEELRPAFVCNHFVVKPAIQIDRFSKWERLLRCIACVHRFIDVQTRRDKEDVLPAGGLTREELRKAERSLWRLAQSEAYPDEVVILKTNLLVPPEKQRNLERSSEIANLPPALDEFGVLRVDSRSAKSDFLSFDTKFPIILPKKHRITELLIDWYHREWRHANDETVVNEIKQRFYIFRLRVLVRLARRNCMWCRVYKSIPLAPKMGPLPKIRLTPFLRPFTFVGIDYFGPYFIKIGRTTVKRWVALFTCLTIRAVHLEVVSSLSTDSCKKAIRRFIARRGAPQEIYSDNGTNFLGASRELAAEITRINSTFSSTFTDAHTRWRFNPPGAPHMGGCWERMVRSVKTALGFLPNERKLDEESLVTLLTEAEHIVNSRPLTFVPLENADQESLCPNHFLIMSSTGVRQPIKDPVDERAALRGSWNMIQHILDKFWHRWIKEYLPTITRRTKWFHSIQPIREGELVMIADEKIRNRWLRGRVVRTYPGSDGTVRRADVLTASGILQRPAVKLAVLDVGSDDTEGEVLVS
ncbi:uncharacterized protein LOC131678438 [Topomyia yanbarensis]|uniref:uncharacterized protein LOC131678438 n=1 Tax=Topomyia yanbarensis TaxID=2498891 RepID=UPI00273C47E4|nr:uncharacterized protein LOC131678438 [Topomyia yanbarensis]XP_058814580.1 uncharacterized protein LOC131678438 [Topomyia yanbarensis]